MKVAHFAHVWTKPGMTPTMEYPACLRAAYGDEQPFSFDSEAHRTRNAPLSILPEDDPMRSIRLFGEKARPALRDLEPL